MSSYISKQKLKELLPVGILILPFITLLIINACYLKLWPTELIQIALWHLFFIWCGIVAFPFVRSIVGNRGELGYGLSKLLGFLLIGYLYWILPATTFFDFTPTLIMVLMLLLSMISFFIFKRCGVEEMSEAVKDVRNSVVISELLFTFIFYTFLVILSFHPEIFGAEKPMDFSLLNSFVREEQMPIGDPWFSGYLLRYYYMGYYLFAGVVKLVGLPTNIAYLTILATLPALFVTTLYSLLRWLTKSSFWASFLSLLLLFSSTWKSFFMLLEGKDIKFSYFWDSTRVLSDGKFAEFPLWSFIFADLHPHVMSYPFFLLLITLFLFYVTRVGEIKKRELILPTLLLSFSLGALLTINSWDFLIAHIIVAVFTLLNFRTVSKRVVLLFPIVSALSIGLYFQMFYILGSGRPTVLKFATSKFDSLAHLWNHFGFWYIALIGLALLKLITDEREEWKRYFSFESIIAIFPIAIGLLCLFAGVDGFSWGPLVFLSMLTLLLTNAFRKSKHLITKIGVSFAITAVVLTTLAEHFIFMDRINTIFKTFNIVWILLALSVVLLVPAMFNKVLDCWSSISKLKKIAVIIIALIVSSTFDLSLIGTGINIYISKEHNGLPGKRPRLDGTHFLQYTSPGTYKVVNWLWQNEAGRPLLMEAYGNSFDNRKSIVSAFTGLRSYLGWAGHVAIRGIPTEEILKRKREIDFVYNSPDALKAHEFLVKNGVKYLMVGTAEYDKFEKLGLRKFVKYSDLFIEVVKSGTTTLYAISNLQ